jgi:hypothetical protein
MQVPGTAIMDALVEAAKTRRRPRDVAIFLIQRYTGMRREFVATLRVQHLVPSLQWIGRRAAHTSTDDAGDAATRGTAPAGRRPIGTRSRSFRLRRGPPGDDASRAGSTTHEREGVRPGYPQKPMAVQ